MMRDVPWGKAWWDPGAADEAASSFATELLKLLGGAYRRAGTPYGEADQEGEVLRRWFDDIRDTPAGVELQREVESAWTFHLQVRFAARQVN